MYRKIFLNQCGYLPKMEKKVTFASDEPVSFAVLRSDGSVAFTGETDTKIENAAAKEVNQIGDFTSLCEEGRFYILSKTLGESETFTIGTDVYTELFQKSMKFFYLQRCGCELPKDKAGDYAHEACHTAAATIYGTDETRDVRGGWHDAGDYGRYVGPGAMTVAQLLMAYEHNEELAKAYPDYLEEVRYEIEWMMKMQRADGALYHKVTCKQFCGFIMPQQEKDELVISPVSVTATADFAATLALAVPFYEKEEKEFADKLATASKKAYEALKNMDIPDGFVNPSEITTGEYGDKCDTDERYFAAAALYKTFGEKQYRLDFENLAAEKIYHGYGWEDMGSYGNRAYLSTTFAADAALKERVEKEMIAVADTLLKKTEADGYETALSKEEYIWGSNLSVANRGLQLMDAYRLTGDEKYQKAAAAQLHYLLGRNPMGVCYVTGCGTNSIKRPHHRPSGFVGKAMPGMLSGGPCNWLADELAKELLPGAADAKCLLDMTGSYSTNEVTIYWNSALIELLLEVIA